jgi:RNA polymerase sigma-70 factor (ECF subfamily)
MQTLVFAAALPRQKPAVRRFGGFGWPAAFLLGRSGNSMPPTSDHNDPAKWIAAVVAQHDRGAFAALFAFYAPRIKGFLIRSGSTAEVAEEIAQETMLAVWRKAALFDASRATVSTWIYTIARNLRIDRLRHENAVSADTLYEALQREEPERPDDTLEIADSGARVRAALPELPPEQLAVVRLAFFEDKPHSDVARLLGIPLGTVKSRLRLAMGKLRKCLDDRQ